MLLPIGLFYVKAASRLQDFPRRESLDRPNNHMVKIPSVRISPNGARLCEKPTCCYESNGTTNQIELDSDPRQDQPHDICLLDPVVFYWDEPLVELTGDLPQR